MAYYPTSQLKTNLYTKGGEYLTLGTKEEYRGYYYITSQGEIYTGKTPGDKPNVLLRPIKDIVNDLSPKTTIVTNKDSFFTIQKPSYVKIQNPNGKGPSLPLSIYPTPTQNDYKLGEFERYFVSKTNEIKFIETNLLVYNQYLSKDPSVAFQLFTPFKLSWVLTGKREEVYKVNIKTVERTQSNLGLQGFTQYFKGRFDQFYK